VEKAMHELKLGITVEYNMVAERAGKADTDV